MHPLLIALLVGTGIWLVLFRLNSDPCTFSVPPRTALGGPAQVQLGPASSSSSPTSCWWSFDTYVPSDYEIRWFNATSDNDREPCSRFPQDMVEAYDAYWVAYHRSSLCRATGDGGCPPFAKNSIGEKPVAPAFFSHFRYKRVCGAELPNTLLYPAPSSGPDSYSMVIEPLVGILRHPRYCQDGNYLVNKDYMFFSDPWLIQLAPSPVRFLYFDAGASTWTSGAGGASQSWIVTEFSSRWCMAVAGIWAWEVQHQDPKSVFGQLPNCIPPVYHWYNIPVATERTSSSNLWRHLQAMATPQDYVVVKIDIDTPHVESKLLKELEETRGLQELIDEMFFEHHANFGPICGAWGTCGEATTYKESVSLFAGLRQAGVRIHSWV